MTLKRINEPQLRLLEALNTYRFLTVRQFIRLGISNTKYGISKHISGLMHTRKPLVAVADFGTFPTIGRLPVLYYLTKHGADWLAEAFQVNTADINHPKGVKIFTRDYFHRVQTINTHISARQFSEKIDQMKFNFFHSYFEHTGANHSKTPNQPKRQALTKIRLHDQYFIPDCIFSLTDPYGKEWMFAGEIYRNLTTKRTYQQLEKHRDALEESSISEAYCFPRAVRVLVICEQENAKKALQKRLKDDPEFAGFKSFFLFKTDEELKRGFPADWEMFTGEKMNAFEKPKTG